MSLATSLLGALDSGGTGGVLSAIKRAILPAGTVMDDMGPVARGLANDMRGIDDDVAVGAGRYMSGPMPLETLQKIPEPKRLLAADIADGDIRGTAAQEALQDSGVAAWYESIRKTNALMNEENLAVRTPTDGKMQVRNAWTGDWQDYAPIEDNYYHHMTKSSKRNAVVQPMQFVQGELEKRLTNEYIGELNKNLEPGQLPIDLNSGMTPEIIGRARALSSAAIDDFFRTGQGNQLLKDKDLLDALQPAYDNFKEISDYLRTLDVNAATRAGKPIPPEVDAVVRLFGSDDPGAQREGIRLFREFLLRDAQNARRAGQIESTRTLPLPKSWRERDPLKVMPVTVLRQQRRLAEIKRFGQDNEAVLGKKVFGGYEGGLLSQIPDEADRQFVKTIFDRHMGLEPWNKSLAANKLMDTVFATQVIKLGTAQISQLGQIMNSIMETGLGPTWTALSDLGRSRNIAVKSGAALSRVMDIVREGLSDPLAESAGRKFSEGFLKWTGFNKADLIARHIGAGAGYAHGQEILRRAVTNPQDLKALKEIRRLSPGMNAAPNAFAPILQKIEQARQQFGSKVNLEQIEQFFEPELLNIARTASLNANFRQSILDLPGWATTPMGRLVTMFRSFAYKQTGFIAKRLWEDLRDGNPRPLVGLAAGAGVLGPLISTLKGIPQGRLGEEAAEYQEAGQDPKAAARKAIENIATVGALGLFDQVARALRRGDRGWYEFMAGPLLSDIANGLSGPGKIVAGATGLAEPGTAERGVQETLQFGARHIPVIGSGAGQAVRALTEDVERHPSGIVTRGQTQVLGQESPPTEILGMRLPAPAVLLGLEPRVTAKRERYMAQLKGAVNSEDMARVRDILQAANKDGVRISATSLQRLIREHRLEQIEAQR